MGKRTRAAYKGWTCPKCGQQFKSPGRHVGSCDGTPTRGRRPKPEGETAKRASRNGHATLHGPVVTIKAGDYTALVDSFQASAAALAEGVRALITERDLYKQERDEEAKVLEGLRGFLNKPADPRRSRG